MKIKDKKNKQFFNVISQSVIEQMLSNSKRYEEVKKETDKVAVSSTSTIQNKDNEE